MRTRKIDEAFRPQAEALAAALEGVRDHMIQQVGLCALAEKVRMDAGAVLPEFALKAPLLGEGKNG